MLDSYCASNPHGQDEMSRFLKEGIAKERVLWESWPNEKQKKYIARTVVEKRKRDPSFGNCADKFLV